MKRALVVLAAITAFCSLIFGNSCLQEKSYPEEYRLDVPHVSTKQESEKYGARIGGYCWLASTTMLMKHFDPTIELWEALVFLEGTTSFGFYFRGHSNTEAAAGLYYSSPNNLLRTAKNLGFEPHARVQSPITSGDKGESNRWLREAEEVGVDVKTYLFSFPKDEFKQLISSGIPVAVSSSPCHDDYQVIEGYSRDKLFIVIPDPSDVGRTDPRMSGPIGGGLRHVMCWVTPGGERKSDAELLSKMKWLADLAPTNLRSYSNYIERGVKIINFEVEKLHLARKCASMYFDKLGYEELAHAYEESSELFGELHHTIYPPEANEHKDEIIAMFRKIADHEESLYEKWPSPVVTKTTDYLEYGSLTITAKEKTPITIVSHKKDVPEGKLVYEVYDIKTTEPLTLTFSYKEYQPANLIRGNLKVIKLSGSEAVEIESFTEENDQRATVSAEIAGSGEYALVLFPSTSS
jgi:hypothetical protein